MWGTAGNSQFSEDDNRHVTPKDPDRRQSAQQRLAAQRAAAAQARLVAARRRRLLTVGGSVGAVLLVVAALVGVKLATGGGSPKSGSTATTATSSVIADVSSVPSNVLDTVGVGTASPLPSSVSAPALTSGGKPLVLYVGAEYCPYCAAERWAVAVALYRFGSFTNLGQTTSSPSDVYPSTPTLTFHGASYTSAYVSFTGKELQSNQVVNGKYAPMDSLTADEQSVFNKYDAPPYFPSAGSIPFVDIGGRYLISGASYVPSVLQGKTHAQIAAALSEPTSAIARAVDGAANLVTAAICQVTNDQPASVCKSAGVVTATTALSNAK
jgi:thiol-disulfide isomerase/thioredoxin